MMLLAKKFLGHHSSLVRAQPIPLGGALNFLGLFNQVAIETSAKLRLSIGATWDADTGFRALK